MKKTISVILAVMMFLSAFAGMSFTAGAALKEGWNKCTGHGNDGSSEDGFEYDYWCYVKNGKKVIGWQKIDGKWYYFSEDGDSGWHYSAGEMYQNEIAIQNGKFYFMTSGGAMKTNGWCQSTAWHYAKSNGALVAKAWEKIGGKWYYFNEYAQLQTGWLKQSGKWYYLGTDGAMRLGWQQVDGKWYYFGTSTGFMHTGWQEVSGKWYYLGTNGVLRTYCFSDGKKYYFANKGGDLREKAGWVKDNKGSWYYTNANGTVKTGWQQLSNVWYYFNEKGVMQSGLFYVSHRYYLADANGKVTTKAGWYEHPQGGFCYIKSGGALSAGWTKISNKWYYFNAKGQSMVGVIYDGNNLYFLDEDTFALVEKTGWVTSYDGNWYYVLSDGSLYTGELDLDDGIYYLDPDEGYMRTGSVNIDGCPMFFNESDGRLRSTAGWVTDSQGKTYYTDLNGECLTGFKNVQNKKRYFDPQTGEMYVSRTAWIDSTQYVFNDDGSYYTAT